MTDTTSLVRLVIVAMGLDKVFVACILMVQPGVVTKLDFSQLSSKRSGLRYSAERGLRHTVGHISRWAKSCERACLLVAKQLWLDRQVGHQSGEVALAAAGLTIPSCMLMPKTCLQDLSLGERNTITERRPLVFVLVIAMTSVNTGRSWILHG